MDRPLSSCHRWATVHLTLTFRTVHILSLYRDLPSGYNLVVLGWFGSFLSSLAQNVCTELFFPFFIAEECTKHKLAVLIISTCTIHSAKDIVGLCNRHCFWFQTFLIQNFTSEGNLGCIKHLLPSPPPDLPQLLANPNLLSLWISISY